MKLKPHHHVTIDKEFRFDCEIWRLFLSNYRDSAVCHPMLDINVDAVRLDFFSDASAAKTLGFRAIYENHWLYARWETNYIHEHKPSIEYLELYAVTAALGHLIQNKS